MLIKGLLWTFSFEHCAEHIAAQKPPQVTRAFPGRAQEPNPIKMICWCAHTKRSLINVYATPFQQTARARKRYDANQQQRPIRHSRPPKTTPYSLGANALRHYGVIVIRGKNECREPTVTLLCV